MFRGFLILSSLMSCTQLLCAAGLATGDEVTTELTLEVDGLRSDSGVLRILIFEEDAGFPSTPEGAILQLVVPVEGLQTRVVIPDLIPGDYAVSLHHDEDNDEELDKSPFGLPREGIGTSNNAVRKFGPPKFEEARISIPAGGIQIQVEMQYWKQ